MLVFVSSKKKHSKYGSLLNFSKKKPKATGSLPVGGFAPQAGAEKPPSKKKKRKLEKKFSEVENLVSLFLNFCHEKKNIVSNKIKNVHYHSNFAQCVLFLREKETRDFEYIIFSICYFVKLSFNLLF